MDHPGTRRAYLWSWVAMIVLTAAAFLAVGFRVLPKPWIGWLLAGLAGIQILVQVVLFMHMNGKRSWYTVYLAMGVFFALVWAYGVWYLVWEVG